MSRTTLLATAILGVALAAPVAGQRSESAVSASQPASARKAIDASTFMQEAARANTAEVALAKLAEGTASNEAVKRYAAMLDQDHTAAGKDLQQVAKSKNVTLPDQLNAEQKSASTKLSALNGAAFDRAFVAQMVADHQKAIELFTEGSAVGDQAVRDFASKTLPKLKQHLQQAQSLQQQVGR